MRNVARTAAITGNSGRCENRGNFEDRKADDSLTRSGLHELRIRPRAICTFAVSLFFFSARFRR